MREREREREIQRKKKERKTDWKMVEMIWKSRLINFVPKDERNVN